MLRALCLFALAGGALGVLDAATQLPLILSTFLTSKRVVIYQFEAKRVRWLDFAQSMYWQLERQYPGEFLALGAFPESCEALGQPRCVTNSAMPAGTHEVPDVHGFWAARYDFFTRLVNEGLDVLMIDSDQQVQGDAFEYLNQPCVARASMGFHAEGGGPNGGTAWARGSGPHAVASWLFGSVARLYPLFWDYYQKTGRAPCSTMDQDFVKDALLTAWVPNALQWDMRRCWRDGVKDHVFWADKPTPGTELPSETMVNCDDIKLFEAYMPRDAGPPATELGHWFPPEFVRFAGAGRSPWPPISKLTHMLGARGVWMPTAEQAAATGAHVSRQAGLQVDGYWGPEVFHKYARHKKLLFIDDGLVMRVERDLLVLRRLVADALLDAANSGRVLVLPQISCDAPWVVPNDPRLMWRARDGACFVGTNVGEECWPWDYVAYAFDNIVESRRQALGAMGDVVVNRFGNTTAHAGAMKECSTFFL